MSLLSQLPPTHSLSPGVKSGEGKKASFALLTHTSEEDREALYGIEKDHVALFIPGDWLLVREQMDQNWTINFPKGKGQETLYSTTFFWSPVSEEVNEILTFAQQKGWSAYTQIDKKVCMLVINSKVGVDIDAQSLLEQFS